MSVARPIDASFVGKQFKVAEDHNPEDHFGLGARATIIESAGELYLKGIVGGDAIAHQKLDDTDFYVSDNRGGGGSLFTEEGRWEQVVGADSPDPYEPDPCVRNYSCGYPT
jgi:hypothetical protein